MMYYIPPDQGFGIAGLLGIDLKPLDLPSQQDLVNAYASRNHLISLDETNKWFGFYLTFLFFKNCVIVQGVAQRAKVGVASSAIASRVADLLPILVAMTKQMLLDYPPPKIVSSL
jgi:hypothetical protein